MSFLVTEVDRNHETNARDFNNIETRFFITFFLKANTPKEHHVILTESLGEYGTLYATVKNWMVQFKLGDFST